MWIGTDLNYFGNNANQILVSVTNMYKNVTHIFCVFEFFKFKSIWYILI